MNRLSKKVFISLIVGILLSLSIATSVSANEDEVDRIRIVTYERLQNERYVITGNIPLIDFDLDVLALSATVLWESTNHIQYHLDQAVAGSEESCAEIVSLGRLVYATTAFHKNVPARYAKAYGDYRAAILQFFDHIDPAFISCLETGQVSNFEYGWARTGMDTVRTLLEPYFNGS